MAVANRSSSAMAKAVLLPLILVVLAMSAGASSTEDGTAVAKSGGRFSETPVGRKLLASVLGLCGYGSAPDYYCKALLPLTAKKPTCCTNLVIPTCFDVGGIDILRCGSCNTKCNLGQVCCSGVCANLLSDKNNCGVCGRTCRTPCILGFCKY